MIDLASPRAYEREIERLAQRRAHDAWRTSFELTAPLVARHCEQVARKLAAEVSSGQYAFAPLVPHAAVLNGKPRTIYALDPLDAVVWGVLTSTLMQAMEPRLGSYLHSYRRGRSHWTACRALLRYLRAHEAARPDPRTRGVFVLRRDVRRYDEHIDVRDGSSLWSTLHELIGAQRFGVRGDFDALLHRAFRPQIVQPDGVTRALERGVPTGLPTQTIACNTYLLPLDRELSALPGSLYGRFGDDIVFAHPEHAVAEHASARIDAVLESLGLQANRDKSQAFYLTRVGRTHPSAAAYQPVVRFAYLGLDVGFDGSRPRKDKRRALWHSLRARLAHTDRLLHGVAREERIGALCEVIAVAFDQASPLCEPYASWLRTEVSSLEDLRQLDRLIALEIAQRVTQQRSVRAFRELPPRVLYQHGLPSLVQRFAAARRRKRGRPMP